MRVGLGVEYRLLWTAAAVSNVGDGLRVAALPLLAAAITRDPARVAAVTAAIWLPWLLLGLHGGAVVDRVDRLVLIRNVQVGRLVVAAGLGVLVLLDRASMPTVYAVAFLVGTGEVLAANALQSLVPRLVARSDLERANSRLMAAETAGNELLGPPLGALLFAAAPPVPFLLDAASYGGSAAAARRLSRRLPSDVGPRVPLGHINREVAEGLRWLRHHPYLRAMTVWGALFNIGSGASFSLLVLLALEVLGTGQFGYGLLLGVVAVGGLVGAAVASPLAHRIGRGRTILIGAVGSGVTVVAVGLVDDVYLAGALLFANSCSGVMVNVVGRALRQSMVPDRLLGRVHSSGRVVVYGGMPIGAALGGWVARVGDLRAAFITGGLIMTAVSVAVAPWLREGSIERSLAAASDTRPG